MTLSRSYGLREISQPCVACQDGAHKECLKWDADLGDPCDCPCAVYEEFWNWWESPQALELTGHEQASHRNGFEDMVAETAWFAARGLIYPGTMPRGKSTQ